MPNLFIDTNTSYQPHSVDYYKRMYAVGARANWIKVTEGTTFTASNWTGSLNNSVSAGLVGCVYHFLRARTDAQARAEATYFAKVLNAGKVQKSIKFMIDAEAQGNSTSNVLAFIATMKTFGYTNVCVYSYKYMWLSVLDSKKLPRPWVATNDGGKQSLGINNAQAWQYATTFAGYSQDVNKDLTKDNWFTTAPAQTTTKVNKKVSDNVTVQEALKVIAQQVIKGTYGNGNARKNNIYNAVQREVNKLI